MKQLCKEGLRKCCQCKEILSLDESNFYISRCVGKAGFDTRCKKCDKERKNTVEYRNIKNNRKRKTKVCEGYVYILESGGFYKIGVTLYNDVNKRIKSMMHGNPLEIVPIMINKSKGDMFSEEKMFHKIYRNKNIRGERFALTADDILSIKEYYC